MDTFPVFYDAEGQLIVRMSAIGSCIKQLVAYKKGLEPKDTPAWLEVAYEEGRNAEETIINEFLKDQGYLIVETQPEVEIKVGNTIARGHIDALIKKKGRGKLPLVILEVKFLISSSYKRWQQDGIAAFKNWPYYAWQISGYIHALNTEAIFVVAEKDPDTREWTGNCVIIHIPVDMAPISKGQFIKRMKEIDRTDNLPVCDRVSYPCPFYYLHTEEDEPDKDRVKLDKDTGDAVDEQARLYITGGRLEEQGKTMKRNAYASMKGFFETYGKRLESSQFKVTDVVQAKQGNIDWNKVPVELSSELDQYRKDGYSIAYPKITDKSKGEAE